MENQITLTEEQADKFAHLILEALITYANTHQIERNHYLDINVRNNEEK